MKRNILRTSLCDLLGIEYPILLAGMWVKDGRATPPPLVAAVSNTGGLGVMAGLGLEPEVLRRRIREVRTMTSKPFGVDLLLPASLSEVPEERQRVRERLQREHPRQVTIARELMQKYGLPPVEEKGPAELSPPLMRRQVEVAVEERVPVLAVALGDAEWAVSLAHAQGIKVIGLAGSLRNALRQQEAGVDIIVAQGYEAGGHTGTVATLPLIPQVVDAVSPTPVVAAGGIADGRGLAASLALGAVGVWCGTAFLLAEESGLWQAHQEQIMAGASEDFIVTRCYTGKT
ncbi:MAG: nitronate monooxygenase, partial [Dehalococcoidia bacterium]|nr:nitronate monooxygenase [Dehalococcoidia bacterium]